MSFPVIIDFACLRRRAADDMRIRLTRKLAECLNGIDLSHYSVGDTLTVPRREAELLIAEGWASQGTAGTSRPRRELNVGQLRRLRDLLDRPRWQVARRAEDRIREDLHDSRARTIRGKKCQD
jgi:hypothetical protein